MISREFQPELRWHAFRFSRSMATSSTRLAGLTVERPLFRRATEHAGAFVVEPAGPDHVRLVMREPHFANNVRYILDVRREAGRLRASWADSEDPTPTGFVEVGSA